MLFSFTIIVIKQHRNGNAGTFKMGVTVTGVCFFAQNLGSDQVPDSECSAWLHGGPLLRDLRRDNDVLSSGKLNVLRAIFFLLRLSALSDYESFGAGNWP